MEYKTEDELGWIKVHRSVINHWIFDSDGYFKAWFVILAAVNHKPKKVLIRQKLYRCERGQSVLSIQNWAKKFGKKWSRRRVQTFFKLLEKDSMIELETDNYTSHLTVCNYSTYQDGGTSNSTADAHQPHINRTSNGTQLKNVKNVKNILPSCFEDFWKIYPARNGKKAGKQKAAEKFKKFSEADVKKIIECAKNYSLSRQAKEGFAKDPSGFLGNGYWKDWEVQEKIPERKDYVEIENPF